MFDDSVFFREATGRICGSLDAAEFLHASLLYVRSAIPVDRAYLTYLAPEKHLQFVLAEASVVEGRPRRDSVPVQPRQQRYLGPAEEWEGYADRAESVPAARPWITTGVIDPEDSMLWIRLGIGEEVLGAVTMTARGPGRFNREHARRLAILREPYSLALSNCRRYRELEELHEALAEDNRFLHGELRRTSGDEIVGAEFGLREVMELVRRVAPRSSPVLIHGETGTGKELIASAIHELSPRRRGPLVKVNCGALPDNLVDSELFGHEKGAFTGAIRRERGRFERAHRGTIFLDEIGELKPEAQVRLLRVLQEHVIERVGGSEPVEVDIRVVAATHRNLERLVEQGGFREDLLFRLAVFPIEVPPLRERLVDLPSLVQHFLRKKAPEVGMRVPPPLAPDALDRLSAYRWRGNVRELENAVERALILSHGEPLTFEGIVGHTGPRTGGRGLISETAGGMGNHRTMPLPLDEIVRRHIVSVLERTRGRVEGPGAAAELLDVNPSTLRKRMRKLEIPFGRGARYGSQG